MKIIYLTLMVIIQFEGRFEFVLLDSLNKSVLGATEEQLWGHVQEGLWSRLAQGKSLTRNEQLIYFQQVRSQSSRSNTP